MLALACGHLREAHISAAVVGRQLSEVVALDQDPLSLSIVRATCAGLPVTCVPAGVGDLLKGRVELGEFDLIYAAGLYDYLPDALARRLTNVLWGHLKFGGKLVVANFVRCWEAAYMEAVMEWYLLYRDESSVRAFAADLSPTNAEVSLDDDGVIAYLTLTR